MNPAAAVRRAYWFLVALLPACHASKAPPPLTHPEVVAVLEAQRERWNAGDLPGFVATYWDGPELTFFGAGGLTRGRADLLANYQRGYPTAKERGVLSFEIVGFEPLGNDHALLLGRYHIQRDEPAHGVFSLVLCRQDGRVVILHDHTTEARPRR